MTAERIGVKRASTGAAAAIGLVMPELKGKLDGMAMRVPVPNGSVVDLVTIMKKDVTVDEVREAVKAHAETDRLKATLRYATEALVSSDIVKRFFAPDLARRIDTMFVALSSDL